MTLSAFLRDYLYIPLCGNRRGVFRRYANLLTTMLLGGLWHGADWTFIVWGGMHGLLLIINHGWRATVGWCASRGLRLPVAPLRPLYWLLTFGAVVLTWVVFRADSFPAALALVKGMAGQSGVFLPSTVLQLIPPLRIIADELGAVPHLADGTVMGLVEMVTMLGVGLFGVLCLPNVLEQTARTRCLFVLLCGAFAVQQVAFGRATEFLYFQF